MSKYAVVIACHGRPHRVLTAKMLRDIGYTGDFYILCDDEDVTLPEYVERFGDKVLVFGKKEWIEKTDTCDNFSEPNNRNVFARNAAHKWASDNGFDFLLYFDDDYSTASIRYKFKGSLRGYSLKDYKAKNAGDVWINAVIKFAEDTGAVFVGTSDQGDYYASINDDIVRDGFRPRVANGIVSRVDRAPAFFGRVDEDIITNLDVLQRGGVCFSPTGVMLCTATTEKNAEGMTETYQQMGHFTKSFYTVMCFPSCTKITVLHKKTERIYRGVKWNNAAPKILSEKWKKK